MTCRLCKASDKCNILHVGALTCRGMSLPIAWIHRTPTIISRLFKTRGSKKCFLELQRASSVQEHAISLHYNQKEFAI